MPFGGDFMWYNHKFFRISTALLLILLIIFMFGKIGFFLNPFKKMLAAISLPILIGTLIYYILRPLVNLLQRIKVPKTLAIVITILVFIGFILIISTYIGSIFVEQFTQLTRALTDKDNIQSAFDAINDILKNPWFESLSNRADIEQRIVDFVQKVTQNLTAIVFGVISKLTNIGSVIFVVPFVVFYFLKDDRDFVSKVLRIVPKKYLSDFKKIIKDIDTTLSSYIVGQMLVILAIGIMMFIGFLIIRIKYPLMLAIFAMVTCIIPYFGPWIGIIPAALLSLTQGPYMVIKVIIVMLVVQQIDNNFISPQVMGKRLDIHPLTVMFLLMISVAIYGIVGMIIAVPLYAATKVTVQNIYGMYVLAREKKGAAQEAVN